MRAKIREHGTLTIPADYRKALGLRVGDEVVLRIEGSELRVASPRTAVQRARSLVRQYVMPGGDLSGSLIQDRRSDAESE